MVKRTLQEIANFFDMAVAVDEDGQAYMYKAVPFIQGYEWKSDETVFEMPYCLSVDFSGDWRESLTLPDSWPKKPKFKEGELVIGRVTEGVEMVKKTLQESYGADQPKQSGKC